MTGTTAAEVDFRPAAADSLDRTAAERLEWAKTQIGQAHLRAVVDLLVTGGWTVEDAREAAMYTLAASYLVAAEDEAGLL
jgi:hypothetical protein